LQDHFEKYRMPTREVKHIVITGVSRGLGRAMTDGFIEAGHRVHGCARSDKALAELRELYGSEHSFDKVDVASDEEVAGWAEKVLSPGIVPYLVINNAAVINSNARLWEVDPEEIAQILDVNIKGVVNVIRHFLPSMVEVSRGIVVNFSSGWGRATSPEVAPYCATKWAIEGMTKALAEELPPGMAAVPLNPGIIDTEMLRSCFGAGAGAYQPAAEWARRAVPFILALGTKDNGQSLSVPD
jgi:NAD(P)-dependent dehydrogenase (short-subunit alcohol dehydrogenase family)